MAQIKFAGVAGAAVRGPFKRYLQAWAITRGFDIHVKEDKGFFESLYTFTITDIPDESLPQVKQDLQREMRRINDILK